MKERCFKSTQAATMAIMCLTMGFEMDIYHHLVEKHHVNPEHFLLTVVL